VPASATVSPVEEPAAAHEPEARPYVAESVAPEPVMPHTNGAGGQEAVHAEPDHNVEPERHHVVSEQATTVGHEHAAVDSEPARPSRRGWWQRRFGTGAE
jgi:hypothetical protein